MSAYPHDAGAVDSELVPFRLVQERRSDGGVERLIWIGRFKGWSQIL